MKRGSMRGREGGGKEGRGREGREKEEVEGEGRKVRKNQHTGLRKCPELFISYHQKN